MLLVSALNSKYSPGISRYYLIFRGGGVRVFNIRNGAILLASPLNIPPV